MTDRDRETIKILRRYRLRGLATRNGSAVPTGTVFSCDDCPNSLDCQWAWDDHNINGDCLAEE